MMLISLIAGCDTSLPPTTSSALPVSSAPTPSDPPSPSPTVVESRRVTADPGDGQLVMALTHHSPDGNRYRTGRGTITQVAPLDIALDGTPIWVLGAPYKSGMLWTAILEDGGVQAFFVENRRLEPLRPSLRRQPIGAPPVLVVEGEQWQLLSAPSNPLNHPILVPILDLQASILPGGALHVEGESVQNQLGLDALPDGRLLQDESGRLLVLGGPTQAYAHAVLGDGIEATRASLVDMRPIPPSIKHVQVPDGQVFEGLSAIWVDINEDGEREIVLTASEAAQGAQIQVFSEEGVLLAASQPIGLGYRWRHQIAVAPFGPRGEIELVSVRTPHLGGVVEFMRWEGADLPVVAQLGGFTSHNLGSRNLDLAVAGDFDGDGLTELLLPAQDRSSLGAVQHTTEGAQLVWELPLDGRLSTNLAVLRSRQGTLSVGAGLQAGRLRLWLSE